MESWVKDFDSWDVCDGCCGNLFDKTEFAYSKAVAWSKRREEFVKRAGFVLMAQLDQKASAAVRSWQCGLLGKLVLAKCKGGNKGRFIFLAPSCSPLLSLHSDTEPSLEEGLPAPWRPVGRLLKAPFEPLPA